jgi:hypothetical protein
MDTGITRVVYKRNSELCGDAAYLKKPFSAFASLPLPWFGWLWQTMRTLVDAASAQNPLSRWVTVDRPFARRERLC